jgi:hypothetical protein
MTKKQTDTGFSIFPGNDRCGGSRQGEQPSGRKGATMLFCSILTWDKDNRNEIIKRRAENGMMMPDNMKLIGEWTDLSDGRDIVIVETDDAGALLADALAWTDIMTFETFPVMEADKLMGAITK